MKILLAVDGSHVTKHMLSYLAAHDELLGPGHTYTFLTVIPPVPGYAAEFLAKKTLDGYYAEQSELVFHPIRGFADQQGWKAHMVYESGHAAETIASLAEREHFDLIVMGTHGHSSLANVVLGSVATGVLARGKVPVLLIR
jgi:nucleotide-binding universal stress UspA family protein